MDGLPIWVRCLVLACASSGAVVAASVAADAADATGRDWKVVSLSGYNGPIPEGVTLRLEPDGRLAGFAGCNRLIGRYSLVDARIVIERPATTFKLCPPAIMAFEDLFLKSLSQGGVSGRLVADEFQFAAPDAGLVLRFK